MRKHIIIDGRYQVIRKIGEGGMAKVYLAYDNVQEMNVALKVLRKENIQEKKIKHFKREANALSLMNDDNIVKIFDVGEQGDIHYIANEYVEGMTLKEYITTCAPLTIEEIINITRQTLDGLAHAHARGVVHKDIKSQNILLNADKKVKITDFGIADIMDDDTTKTQSVMGTPQYVAPEILNREDLTSQSDIYSVGILMFEMIVGHAPFTGEKPAVIMIKQMNHPLPSIRDARSDCPQSLENIVIKAAAKTLTNRYKSCEDMLYDLGTVLESERLNEKKLLLKDDILTEEKLQKSVSIDDNINYKNIKDQSDKELKKRKNRRKILLTVIPIIVSLFAVIIYFNSQPTPMPDLIGETETAAKDNLIFANVLEEDIEIKYEISDTVEKDTIIRTDPVAGEPITPTTKIVLYVSEGKEEHKMKDYVGALYSSVSIELQALGFLVSQVEVENSASKGTIIGQSVEVDSVLEEKQEIVFEVSSGQTSAIVPNFNDMSLEEVEGWAAVNGMTVNVKYECNDKYAKDKVFGQSPTVNQVMYLGQQVTVDISEGSCPKEVPPVETPPASETPATETPAADKPATGATNE